MALVRKGSRRIVVDGTAYRWQLRRRPTYHQALAWWPCTYAVEHAEPGTTLVVTTNQPHIGNWFGRPGSAVLPSDVADVIKAALQQGLGAYAYGLTISSLSVRRLLSLALSLLVAEYRN